MKRSTLLLIALLPLLATSVAAQVNDTYVIPAAGNTPGAFLTRWMTQFSVFNPQAHALTITVVYLPTGGGRGIEAAFTVPANSVAFSDNILDDLFDVAGSGALLVATFQDENPGVPDNVISRAFLVTTNTYNNSPKGTFGQTIAGIWTGLQDYQTDGISAIAHGVRHISRLGWRTNIGAVNLGRTSVTMRVTVFDADGRTRLDRAPFLLPPFAHLQDVLPIEIDRGTIEFFVDDPSQTAVVFPYAATVDQLSGDPTYHSPVLLATPAAIYSKMGMPADPTSVGKRIDSAIAAEVRANAERRPRAQLVPEGDGYRITQ
ncbi:MAG TPA: hypothetical protein VNA04_04655 [Thermoanaerobaculia bacterium]|nr:hypothetical protein [Thermoanaerobaculia bacterium]